MKHVESLFFGSSAQLFGMYHPATGHPRNHGVVVCAPLFHEYYRSHFTVKRIAVDLATQGYEVLRFDYTGTGDSKGEIPPDMFGLWSADIGEAIAEIQSLSGCTKVSLIAARFSASLCLPWQAKINKYVCWDSILDYRDYMKQLDAMNIASVDEHFMMSNEERVTYMESDYLGTGLSRTSFSQMLSGFAEHLDAQELKSLPENTIEICSDTNWVSASLKMIYAHDTVKQITDVM